MRLTRQFVVGYLRPVLYKPTCEYGTLFLYWVDGGPEVICKSSINPNFLFQKYENISARCKYANIDVNIVWREATRERGAALWFIT